MEITLGLAFIAGLVSFISPCVLPLVPAYIGYMGGRVTHTVALSGIGQSKTTTTGYNQRLSTVMHGLSFVAGFTFIFVTLGLLSTAFVSVIGGQNISVVTNMIGRVGGLLIIFFGLHFMGVLPTFFNWLRGSTPETARISNPLTSVAFAVIGSVLILWGFTGTLALWDVELWQIAWWSPALALLALAGFLTWLFLAGAFTTPRRFWSNTLSRIENMLYADTRRQMTTSDDQGYASSAIMGVVFAAGWTPCIGPVYGAVLTMAANEGDVAQAGVLLAVYSLGLGIPFLVTAFALDSAQGVLRRLQRSMRTIQLASGAFLVLIGVLVASGQLQSLSQQFSSRPEFIEFSIAVEESVLDMVTGGSPEVAESADEEADTSSLIVPNPETAQQAPQTIAIPEDSAAVDLTTLLEPDAETGSGPTGLAVGSFAPQFETVNDRGQPVRLADLRGEVVLLNFWATWCGPCRVEMPEFQATYDARSDEGFTVLAINSGETAAAVQDFREELGLSFPLLMDENGALQNLYSIISYPSTFVLDRDGKIIARHFGPLTADQIHDLVNDALAA